MRGGYMCRLCIQQLVSQCDQIALTLGFSCMLDGDFFAPCFV
jgi:hypothetical protein